MKKLDIRGCLVFAVVCMVGMDSQAAVSGRRNVIQIENEKAGTTDWVLTKIKKGSKPHLYAPDDEQYDKGWRRRKEVEGYCSHTSIRAGETLDVYVSTDPTDQYNTEIYRMGITGAAAHGWCERWALCDLLERFSRRIRAADERFGGEGRL